MSGLLRIFFSLSPARWLCCLLTMALVAPACMAEDDGKFVVVLDPGHGGHDPGAVGAQSNEKSIVLSVAKLLKDKIEANYPDEVKVVMTRSTDKFVELQQRADIANKAHGDLFISIHTNSLPKNSKKRKTMCGVSVYTCGLHKTQNNLEVAMRENAVMELEADYTGRYEGFDPNSSESYIMFELSQNMHQQQSIRFADMAQRQLVKSAGRADLSVRQAGFWVLWSTAMPAVLVELDFICNPTVESFLRSKDGQRKCADALYRAFEKYYQSL